MCTDQNDPPEPSTQTVYYCIFLFSLSLEQRLAFPSVNVSLSVFPAGPCRFSGAQWHMQNVLKDSVESSDDEFFDARGQYTFLCSPSHSFPNFAASN